MLEVFKNVYFHKLDVYKRSFVKNTNQADTQVHDYLDIKQKNSLLDDIIKHKLKNNCVEVNDEFGTKTIEFLKYDEQYIFARMGKYQDILTVHLRNKKTLEPEEISKTVDQELEIFTYFLLDRSNFLISFLKEMSAPSINTLALLIDTFYSDSEIFGEIKGVIVDDAIPLLKKKDIIGTISYKMVVPTNKLISIDTIGLTEAEYMSLRNQKHVEIQVKLVAERNKSAFEDSNALEKLIRRLIKIAKNVQVRAKNEGEYMQPYDVIDDLLTKKVKFQFDRNSDNIHEEIYRKLKVIYETNKREIIDYVRDDD
ncbi:MAG: hypothetical protein C6W57_03355 [Caldibacillus debilis]|uniref:hypothetical protein n=1 Tax=Caldibacillus debilis TaxID=301148 RepID=UPI000E364BE3|nr:hypothetical protein [Caldibacillus debilis]REJ18658.1 MAG: hypothetical protein C6W57_03355 [Caldibacillus debilis]